MVQIAKAATTIAIGNNPYLITLPVPSFHYMANTRNWPALLVTEVHSMKPWIRAVIAATQLMMCTRVNKGSNASAAIMTSLGIQRWCSTMISAISR